MAITLAQICDAVKTTVATVSAVKRAQSYNELSEGMNDLPAVQIYPESVVQDVVANRTDRTTFQAGVRQSEIVIHVDVYARQRSHLDQDMAKVVELTDSIMTVLEAQNTKPYFGLDGLKAFAWVWTRVVFEYGDPNIRYAGGRFVLTFRVF